MSTFLPFFHNLLSAGVIPLSCYTASVFNDKKASAIEPITIDALNYTNNALFGIVDRPNEGSRVDFSSLNAGIYLKYENGVWFVFHTWSCNSDHNLEMF